MLKTVAVSALLASIGAAAVAPGITETGATAVHGAVCAAAVAPGATETGVTAVQSAVNGDGLPARTSEPACSQTGWPHYTDRCIYRGVQPDHARQVRVITVDRLPE